MLQILLPLAFLPVRRSYLVVVDRAGIDLHAPDDRSTRRRSTSAFSTPPTSSPYVFTAAVAASPPIGSSSAGLVRRRAALARWSGATLICGVFWGAIPPRDRVHGGFSMMTMKAPTAADIQKDKYLRSCTRWSRRTRRWRSARRR